MSTGIIRIWDWAFNAITRAHDDELHRIGDVQNAGIFDPEHKLIAIVDALDIRELRREAWHEVIELCFYVNPVLEAAFPAAWTEKQEDAWIDTMAHMLEAVCAASVWQDKSGADLLPTYRGGDDEQDGGALLGGAVSGFRAGEHPAG